MTIAYRAFVKHSVAAFTTWLAGRGLTSHAPGYEPIQPRVPTNRNLVMLYLAGGNDALSFLVPYTDGAYYSRRPTQAVPAARVLQIGSDAHGTALGLHPCLTGLKAMFEQGHVALIQRTGYQHASRSHFLGADIVATADPDHPQGTGWLGRYLDALPAPVDPLCAWNAQFQLPRALLAETVGVPSIRDPGAYAYFHPWGEAKAAAAIAAHLPPTDRPLAFVNSTTQAALATIDRVAAVAPSTPPTPYPETELGATLQLVAAAIASEVGSTVFWVQTDGYDTHAAQGTINGLYARLLTILNDALLAFHDDLQYRALLDNTLILQFSEFGRRIDENGSQGTDHGAAGLMTAIGGAVRGGIYGTAAGSLADISGNPDLENGARDVTYATDFRSVYARIIDHWLDADSVPILLGDYRNPTVAFI